MRVRGQHSRALLLLLPILVATSAAGSSQQRDLSATGTIFDGKDGKGDSLAINARGEIPTRDAPVNGEDGKPHLGPFLSLEGKGDKELSDLPPLKGRPKDSTIVDGKEIPQTNDGVMFDSNRDKAVDGTTGTEGGVSTKDRAREAIEHVTGEKLMRTPEPPKEQPTIPQSEESKAGMNQEIEEHLSAAAAKDHKADDAEFIEGYDKPDNLPDRSHGGASAKTVKQTKQDDVVLTKPKAVSAIQSNLEAEEDEGIIQPFHSFILSLTMILVSEIGDKTFLVAALMAMKYDRLVVFSAAYGALFVMTVLSAVLGHVLPSLLPSWLTNIAAAALFFVFGAKLLREGMAMDPNEGVSDEMHEVEQELAAKEKELGQQRNPTSDHALEMGLNGRSRPAAAAVGHYTSPPRSPSQSPSRGGSGQTAVMRALHGAGNLFSLVLSPAWVQTFVMTFLGEWGDRSQIATIAMAAGPDYWWVILGALFGHAACTGVAVIGGRAIAGRVSLKVVTVGGAVAFLVFGFIYALEAIY